MPLLGDDFHFENLKKKVMEDVGFQTQHYGDRHLKRRFMVRMRVVGANTHRDYLKYLESDPAEYQKLLEVLTVNVTEWFRNPEVFKVIEKRILPDIVRTNMAQGRKSLRIWSVGCSDGKEPYSLAILVNNVIARADDFTAKIIAWDIDDQMLKIARFGLYTQDAMKGLDKRQIQLYFTKEVEGFRIRPEIRSIVDFNNRDINKDIPLRGLDLIICRNLVIYFKPERKADLYMELYHSLRPNGYFVMGKSETLMGESQMAFKKIDNVNRIYQK